MSIKAELLRLQQADPDNILRPVEVIEWAKDNPDSELYRSLEWDDEKAAHEFRLHQVRTLIQLHVVTENREPMLVSLSIDRKNPGGGYRSVNDVIERPDLREILLEDALAELARVQRKYEAVMTLKSVWEEADRVREEAISRRKIKRPSSKVVAA